jgi:spore germination protein KC
MNNEWMIHMKKIKVVVLIALIYSFTCQLSGCWNYREIDKLAIVSGVAIDQKENGNILVTVEIAHMKQEQGQTELSPIYIQAEGDTFFSTIRTIVALESRRLYWSHAKVIIVSEDIAKEGISYVLDFTVRDAEIREDMWILVSREKSASEIFSVKSEMESIISFELDETLRSNKAISQFPAVELYEFIDAIETKGTATVIPTVMNIQSDGRVTTYVTGTAILKHGKLLGYLNEDESKSMLWIQDKLDGGIFVSEKVGKAGTNVSLEIYKSRTKMKPKIEDDKLIMTIDVTVDTSIGEIMGSEDFISEEGRKILKMESERQIKEHLESLIEKAQKELKTDFLGFGAKVKYSMPEVWKTVGNHWEEFFTDMDTNINVDVRIRGSATTKKPIKAGK